MSENSGIQDCGFLRLPAVLKLVPVGKSTWWRGVKVGRFPKSVKLGPNTTAWRAEDIMKLMETFR
jgi:prophage regulatory protein